MTEPNPPSPDEPAGAVERAVLAVLTGTPRDLAARNAGITPEALTESARAYRQAGRAALAAHGAPSQTWNQVIVEFIDGKNAEHAAATALAPRLQEITSGWWFLRKNPDWRIRYLAAPGATVGQATERVGAVLDGLTKSCLVRRWRHGIYEPETVAFGGSAGISIAHELFCIDTVGFLNTFGQAMSAADTGRPVGRKELSILLCAALMRAAHLDWFEQGDTWHRVTNLRPTATRTHTRQHHDAIRTLLTASTTATSPVLDPGSLAAPATAWIAGFCAGGRALAAAARDSQLERGLRDILAHLIIFHWNRLGLPAATQAVLARTAQDVILNTAEGR